MYCLEVSGRHHAPAALPQWKEGTARISQGGKVAPRAGLGDLERRRTLPLPGLELRLVDQPVARLTVLSKAKTLVA
jgi:hypothetical protein